MDAKEIKRKFFEFFKERGHAIIPSAPLIPEHDPTVLFTTAGMHPLVPFLLGQPHPMGKRLANVQKCLRTDDIDEVGDERHLTFFEMLGNWSLGDYFKKEAITWSFEFLTKVLKIDKNKIYVTVFGGEEGIPRDEEAAKIWQEVGIPKERIFYLGKKDNWWGPVGETGPCGPDTEIFIDTGKEKCSPDCRPGCDCGKYLEVWNNVFMQYNKTKEGKYEPLKQKNIDTGMGLERITAVMEGKENVFETELFEPIINFISKNCSMRDEKSIRIIADHIKAATFILGDERKVAPSNTDQGYILRRLIRRAIRYSQKIGFEKILDLPKIVLEIYKDDYPILLKNKDFIFEELKKEKEKFEKTLSKGLRVFNKIASNSKQIISGKDAFLLFQSYGFPIEMTVELAKEKGLSVDVDGFKEEFKKHQEISRKGLAGRFKGGLADASEMTIKLHTATHLLGEALRRVVDPSIRQRGSNITPQRLRFDFNFPRKLTPEELKKVEDLVNEQIKKGLPVYKKLMSFEEAKKIGAQAEFEHKYGEKVYVYFIDDFSKEVCGGPHVKNTKELGHFKIIKHESIGAGIKRIKAVLERLKI